MQVEVLENGAIYVDGTRITDRSTKPVPYVRTVDSFTCRREALHEMLRERGHADLVAKIDAAPFT